MSGLKGDGYRVLGVTVDGPPPLGRVHLDLRAGLSVLYGLNGAGKTRLLEALIATCQGYALEGGSGVLHVQIQDMTTLPETGFPSHLLDAVRVGALREEWAFEPSAPVSASESFAEAVEWHLSRVDYEWEAMDVAIGEAAFSGYFSLHANGTDLPSWGVWISDCIREGTPLDEAYRAAAALVPRSMEIIERANRGHPGEEIVQEMVEVGEQLRRQSPWDLNHPAVGHLDDDFLLRPFWVPFELARVGPVARGPVEVVPVDGDESDVNMATARLLAPKSGGLFPDKGSITLHPEAATRIAGLEQEATDSVQSLLGNGLKLRFLLGDPEAWFLGTVPHWVCDDEFGSSIPISQLSSARRRWATAAIRLVIGGAPVAQTPSVILSDEPEAGLHRTAETQMVSGLTSLTASSEHVTGIVSTHSPAFLAAPAARLLHVRRNLAGRTEALALDGLPGDDDLGLTKADILALRRVFVLVEGEHDKIVLRTLFSDELRRDFAEVFVLRGALHAITAAHAEWLLAASDAPILIVMDKLNERSVTAAWESAREHFQCSRIDDAVAAIRQIRNVPKDEAGFLARLGESAVRSGMLHRLYFFGLGLDDILLYLPDGERLFKEKKKGLLANNEVELATRSLDSIHPHLTALVTEVHRLAAAFGKREAS